MPDSYASFFNSIIMFLGDLFKFKAEMVFKAGIVVMDVYFLNQKQA